MNYPSRLIQEAVEAFTRLPGIGKKTALRLVLHLLKQEKAEVRQFSEAVRRLREEIQYCRICHNIADEQVCQICQNPARNQELICVVENFRDVIAIENTGQYSGLYHVLGGVISPVEGIGPENLNIQSLIDRVTATDKPVKEIIMALNPTIEGDTTIFYISKKLKDAPVTITTLARGIAFGGDLEYIDEVTLGRSISTRMPYENYLINR